MMGLSTAVTGPVTVAGRSVGIPDKANRLCHKARRVGELRQKTFSLELPQDFGFSEKRLPFLEREIAMTREEFRAVRKIA